MKGLDAVFGNISMLEVQLNNLSKQFEREKANIFNAIVESSPNFTAIIQQDKFVYINSVGRTMLGCRSSKDIVGKPVSRFIDYGKCSRFHDLISNKFMENGLFNEKPLQFKLLTTDGKVLYIDGKVSPFDFNNTPASLLIARDITQELLSKSLLKQSESRYRDIFDNSLEGLFLLNVKSNSSFAFLEINKRFEEEFGLSKAHCIGGVLEEVLPVEIANVLKHLCCKAIINNERIEDQYSFDLSNGRRTFVIKLSPVLDEDGKIHRLSCAAKDISEKYNYTEELKQRNSELEDIQRIGNIGIIYRDLNNLQATYTDEVLNIFEISREKNLLSFEEFLRIVHVEDRDKVKSKFAALTALSPATMIEYRLCFDDGRIKYISETCEVQKNFEGVYFQYFSVMQDVTKRKTDESQLTILGNVLKEAPYAVYINEGTQDQRFYYVNDAACKSLGYERDELLRLTIFDIDPISSKEFIIGVWNKVVEKGSYTFETKHRRKSGGLFPVEIKLSCCRINDVSYSISQVTDLTEKEKSSADLEQTYQKLIENEQLYDEFLDNTHDSVFLLDVEHGFPYTFLKINAQLEREMGLSREHLIGKTVDQNYKSPISDAINNQIHNCLKTRKIIKDTFEIKYGESVHTFKYTIIPVFDKYNNIYRAIGIKREITDELKIKKELQVNHSLLQNAEIVGSMGHYYMDFPNNKFHISKGVARILELEYDRDITENVDVFEYIHPDDVCRVKAKLQEAFENNTQFDEVHRIVSTNNQEKIVRNVGSFKNSYNISEMFLGNIQDISDIYILEKKVSFQEERMRILAQNSPLGIYITDDKSFSYVNRAMMDLLGAQSIEEFNRINFYDFVHKDDLGMLIKLQKQLRSDSNVGTESYQLTIRGVDLNGNNKVFDLRFFTCLVGDSKYYQVTVVDITAEIEKEKMLNDIATDSLLISQKNAVISKIRNELDIVLENSLYKKSDFRVIINLLDSYAKNENDWGLFNKHFENLHPGFIDNLKIFCPSLTLNDIKHCACIRLNFDTKEIARFFNVSPSSIQTSRVRLKKKMNLPEQVDLKELILNI